MGTRQGLRVPVGLTQSYALGNIQKGDLGPDCAQVKPPWRGRMLAHAFVGKPFHQASSLVKQEEVYSWPLPLFHEQGLLRGRIQWPFG